MKRSLFLYLFILAVLVNIFTYMYFSKNLKFEKENYKKLDKKLTDSIMSMNAKVLDAGYFALENNQNAQDYFERDNVFLPYQKLIPYVKDKLMDFNDDPKGNPYTGQDQLGANKFIINKIRLLNHRWIICDYSDGEYWGEALIKYFVNTDHSVSFETMQSIIYQK